MRNTRLIRNAALTSVVSLAASVASAGTFNGNGASGFGGGVGNSTLTVTDGGSTVNFSITSAANTFDGNNLVLYIDSVAGGTTDTSTFTDNPPSDPGRTAISGLSSSGRSLVTFPVGFGADYGVSVEIGSFAGLFNLSTPSNFGFVAGGNIAGSGLGPITFSFNKADLGLPAAGGSFNFVGTLISGTAYRSNETIGTSVTIPTDGLGNAGFIGSQSFALANTVVVPEPTTLAALGALVVAGLRRRK